jgi:hypothetical protein
MNCVLAFLIAGTKTSVNRVKASLPTHSTTEEQGEMQDDVGCKIERDKRERWMKAVCNIDHDNTQRWLKLDSRSVWNGVDSRSTMRKLSRRMSAPTDAPMNRMYKVLNYVQHLAAIGQITKPNAVWDGVNRSFEVDYREDGVIAVPWLSNKLMWLSDICMKNVGGSDFVSYLILTSTILVSTVFKFQLTDRIFQFQLTMYSSFN